MPGYAATILQDTPNLYYRFGEAVGSTVVRDTSGHNFNGSLSATGVTLAEPGAIIGSNNTCYLFDGQTGLVTMPTTFNIAGVAALSVETWINFTGTAFSNQPTIVGNAVPSISNAGLSLWIDTNASAVHIALGNGVANTTVSASYPFVAGTWYHIVATWYAATAIILYVNGVSVATGALSGSIGSSTGTMTIAHNPYASNDYFPGQQDEVAFYPYGLSADRVLAHYNAGNPPNNNPGGLPGQKFVTVNGIAVSNFLFGTNMSLDFVSNTVRNTPAIQAQVKSGGFQLMRCAIPDGSSNAYIDETANACIACGCQMLVILIHNDLAWNSNLVQYLGSRCNLYEFSNEPDINNLTYTQYYNLWAAHIPTLRSINPQAAFIGPVLGVFANVQSYLVPWLQLCKASGNPQILPDAISYHMYPCTNQPNATICASLAPNIGNTVPQMNSAVSGVLGHTLPLCITEWNIDANDQAYTLAPAFNVPWTKTALDSMVANGLAMACQYDCAGGAIDLISTTSPYSPLVQYAPMVFEITKYLGAGGTSSTPLTTYLASATSASLGIAEQLYTTAGTPPTTTRDIVVGTGTGFGELTSNGNTTSSPLALDSPYGSNWYFSGHHPATLIPDQMIDLLVGGNRSGLGVETGLVPGGPVWLRSQLRWEMVEYVQTIPPTYDFTALDDLVTRCNANNILVDVNIMVPPQWRQTIDLGGQSVPYDGQTYIGTLNQTLTAGTSYPTLTVSTLGSTDTLANGQQITIDYTGTHPENVLVSGNYSSGATTITITTMAGGTFKPVHAHSSGCVVKNSGGQFASAADTADYVSALISRYNGTTTNYLTGAAQPALTISAIQWNEDYDGAGSNAQRDVQSQWFVTNWQTVGPIIRTHAPNVKIGAPAVRRTAGTSGVYGLAHIQTWINALFTYQPPGSSIVGASRWLDFLDFHYYRDGVGDPDPSHPLPSPTGTSVPTPAQEMLAIKQVAANNGIVNMDVWCTETGWDVFDDGTGTINTVSFQQQADFFCGPSNSGNLTGNPGTFEQHRLNRGSHVFIWVINPTGTGQSWNPPSTAVETKDTVINMQVTSGGPHVFQHLPAYDAAVAYAAAYPQWGIDSPYGVTFLIANNFVNIPAKLIDLLVGGNTAGTGVEAGLVPGGPIWLRIQLRWSKIETSPGVFDSGMLGILIDAVTRCNAANILVDFVVQSPPTWHQTIDFNGNPQPAPGTTYIGGFLNKNIVGSTRYTAITVKPLGSSDSLVNGEAIALSFGGQHEEDLLVVGNYGPGATVLTVTDLSGNTWKAAFSHASGTTTVQNAGGQYASGADTIPFVDALASLFNNTTINYLTGATQPALFISAIQHNEDYDLFGTNTQRDFAPCAFVTMWQVVGPHLRAHLHPTCKLVGPAVRFTRPDGIDPIWGLNHITTWQNHIFTYQPPGSSIVGCAQWLDALDFHLYREGQNLAGNEDPSQSVTLSDGSYFPAASEEMLAIKQVAANNGYFGMDVWCTETGWDVWDSGNGHTATVSFQQQSDYYNGPANSGNVSGGHPGMYEMLRLNGGSHCFIWTVNPHSTANTSVTPNTSTETKDVVMNISGTFTKQLAYTQTATYAATNPTWQIGWSGGTTIGAPSGRGWLYDGTTLDNQELLAGIYNGTLRLQAVSVGVGSGTLSTDLYRRGFKYTPSNGTYTQIVSTLISGQTIGSTAATYVTAGSGILQPFSAGEKFYVDEWANVTANTNGDIHQAIRLLNLSTDTGGHTGNPTTAFATPGFLPTPPSGGGTPPGIGRAFAMMRYGDGKSTSLRPLSLPVPLVYSIASSQYADPLSLSYRIEAADVAQVILSYTISPHAVITMNGDATIIAPDQITYTPRSVANRSLVGTPQLQNYMTMTWSWTVLQVSEYAAIVSHYNPANPIVTLVYPDDMGTWVQRQVVMHPPTYGTQQMQQVTNVSITFTRLLY